MKDKNLTQLQPPLGPPLTGGRQESPNVTLRLDREAIKPSSTAPPLSEAGSHVVRAPNVVPLAGARGGREGFVFVAYNKNLIKLARENRKNPTAAESKLWNQLLRMSNLSGYKFSRQKPIANYIASGVNDDLTRNISSINEKITKQ